MSHAFYQLREASLSTCTKAFKARGSIVKRCSNCQLALFACMCSWQLTRNSDIRFILVVHRKELYKTTNTGRLIADLFPESTSAYLWSRTEPDLQLLAEIKDSSRQLALLFPEKQEKALKPSESKPSLKPAEQKPAQQQKTLDERPLTVILLDGTWKQASRMANLSAWLQGIERIGINTKEISQEQVSYIRKADHDFQLSTAQAAACILREQGKLENAELLEHYFSVFNQHCKATRSNIPPAISSSHIALEQAKLVSKKDKLP